MHLMQDLRPVLGVQESKQPLPPLATVDPMDAERNRIHSPLSRGSTPRTTTICPYPPDLALPNQTRVSSLDGTADDDGCWSVESQSLWVWIPLRYFDHRSLECSSIFNLPETTLAESIRRGSCSLMVESSHAVISIM
ncbi:hypothetical protein Mp_4g11310 [Marchantia polymorpha subsp. ruderalis]|uniref:Uncharacterized protein n=2 Tax=Marchantia polymorpha TaxID=3197 RepID=A0AAF6B8R9_MARPO|nr:hypothetical protein MARPO_0011s0116 [Marchantia polymorpha]BBN08403.1 hypothetical protein Mp_4g11310 [Marchantia polymorpha subsp. ruderalis]|eukprot:PTQ46439.1 hypothetical protein MARPO_0011s0116 [Marchantia polymorpha]